MKVYSSSDDCRSGDLVAAGENYFAILGDKSEIINVGGGKFILLKLKALFRKLKTLLKLLYAGRKTRFWETSSAQKSVC